MDVDEITKQLSDNHLMLIVAGCVVSFIALFLPFWSVLFAYGGASQSLQLSLLSSWMFWPYLIIIGGVGAGYFLDYGKKQPQMFLAAGAVLILMTVYATTIGTSVLTSYLMQLGANVVSGLQGLMGTSGASSLYGSGVNSLVSGSMDAAVALVARTAMISLSYGAALELLGAVSIAVGGYYYSKAPEPETVPESSGLPY